MGGNYVVKAQPYYPPLEAGPIPSFDGPLMVPLWNTWEKKTNKKTHGFLRGCVKYERGSWDYGTKKY